MNKKNQTLKEIFTEALQNYKKKDFKNLIFLLKGTNPTKSGFNRYTINHF